MDGFSNDINPTPMAGRVSDAHGHAALMLVESLIHSLIARSVISSEDASDIVAIAVDATEEIADDLPVRPTELDQSIALLNAISHSLTPTR